MRTAVIAFGLVCLMGAILGQNVGIGTSTPDPSARLDVSDTQRGILIPRLTTAERNAITNPAHSLLIYNTTCNEYQYYIPGTGWVSILTNVTAGGGGSGTLTASPATGIWSGGFTAHWSPVPGATSYEVRVYQACGSSTVVATATFPAWSTSGSVSVSMPCNQTRCYEVRATLSNSSCGTAASLLISNPVPVTGTSYPCSTPNTWVSLPRPPLLLYERTYHLSIAHNGFIYVGFGVNSVGSCIFDWWRWEPCSGTWTRLASPPVNFGTQPFIFAIGPYIYVGGGQGCFNVNATNVFYRYDPATNTWTARANLPVPLAGAVGASDGSYGYVAGGYTSAGGGGFIDTLYRYDPTTNSWTTLSTVPGGVGRYQPSMAYYQRKLYIGMGGTGQGQMATQCLQDFYAYDIATNTWTTLPNNPRGNIGAGAVAYNGKIYFTGELLCSNNNYTTCTDQFYYYDIASNTWSPMPVFPGGLRNHLHLVELNGVLYGGFGTNCTPPFSQSLLRDWWAFCP